MTDVNGAAAPPTPLRAAVVELERHAHGNGWDQRPTLYALVETAELVAAEPGLADRLGLTPDQLVPGSLTPVEQEALGDGPLDDALARIAWPEEVLGCAVVQEVFVLPPDAEQSRPEEADPVAWAAGHESRREVRMVVGVLRDGASACVLRLRQPAGEDPDPEEPEVVYGDDLVPNLIAALRTTLD
ncbi:MAG TPA: PPA1309 family protein [Cryptosporangiaceae bacterium]|nr:PPA1309 family protein [Cryptosporangiaceae bacterium]